MSEQPAFKKPSIWNQASSPFSFNLQTHCIKLTLRTLFHMAPITLTFQHDNGISFRVLSQKSCGPTSVLMRKMLNTCIPFLNSLFLFCSSHVGSWRHRCAGPVSGCVLHLLCFQKMLREKEKAKENEGEKGRSPEEGKGRRRRGRREGTV